MASAVLMSRALKNGRVVSIADVERGLACGCVCVSCGAELIARKGLKNSHCFAHNSDAACDWSGETELHLIAKEVLEIDKKVNFRLVSLAGSPQKIQLNLNDVELEHRIGGFVADLAAITDDGDHVVVEICVNHPCEMNKIATYKQLRLNAIEIILPSSLLVDMEVIDINSVRSAMLMADTKCLSIDPLSGFAEKICNKNEQLLSQQGRELSLLRKEIRSEVVKRNGLIEDNKQLEILISSKSSLGETIKQNAKVYRERLYNDIRQDPYVLKYEHEKSFYQEQLSKIKEDFDVQQRRITSELAAFEADLKSQAENHILHREEARLRVEIERLKKEVADIEAFKDSLLVDGKYLEVSQYIDMINEKYENSFHSLENNWIVMERLQSEVKRPAFVSPQNRQLPVSEHPYKRIRG